MRRWMAKFDRLASASNRIRHQDFGGIAIKRPPINPLLMFMEGQGSPFFDWFRFEPAFVSFFVRSRGRAWLAEQGFLFILVVLVVTPAFTSGGEGPVDKAPTRGDFIPLYDEVTRPFRLRSTVKTWPLTETDQQVDLSVQVDSRSDLANTTLRFDYELLSVPTGTVIAREQTRASLDGTGSSEPIPVANLAPSEPGVYAIRLRLVKTQGKLWDRLSLKNDETVAETSTPWLVASNETRPEELGRPIERTSLSEDSWDSLGLATNVDANQWIGTRWLPDATKLVPAVKRVGESLPIPSWREQRPVEDKTLSPNSALVALLPKTDSERLCRIHINLGSDPTKKTPSLIGIEISTTPQFDRLIRTYELSVANDLDISMTDPWNPNGIALMHCSTVDPTFIRIKNIHEDQSVEIKSIEIFGQAERLDAPVNASVGVSDDRPRRILWSTESWSWIGALTEEFERKEIREKFDPINGLFALLWEATQDLEKHRRWLGYDQLIIRTYGSERDQHKLGQLIEGADDRQLAFAERMIRPVFEAWVTDGTKSVAVVEPDFRHDAATIDYQTRDIRNGKTMIESTTRSALLQRILNDSPQRFVIHSETLPNAVETKLPDFIRHVKRIPASMRGVAGLSQLPSVGVHVFVSPRGSDDSVVTIFNLASWTNEVRLEWLPTVSADDSIVMPPATLMAIPIRGVADPIRQWSAAFQNPNQSIENLKSTVSTVVSRIGSLATPGDYRQIRNGDFETPGKVGIVGWMHTQYPADAVTLDSDEASQGNQSIRLQADEKFAGGVWLVSEPIKVPLSGRLAVSMAIRAGAQATPPNPIKQTAGEFLEGSQRVANASGGKALEPDRDLEISKHIVRVSLEGIRGGEPVRFASEVSVPRDGQWLPRDVVLEADRLDRSEIDFIRLTIDSLSEGKLWVDDVHLHDQFATRSERTQLQGKAFLAIQGLQRGDYLPSVDLLRNRWARYLLTQSPEPPREADTLDSEEARATGSDFRVESTIAPGAPIKRNRESVTERIRLWLPRPIRF